MSGRGMERMVVGYGQGPRVLDSAAVYRLQFERANYCFSDLDRIVITQSKLIIFIEESSIKILM